MTPRQMGRRLQQLREARALSRQQVAQKAWLSREGVRLIEAGRIDPTLGTLTRLAKALGVSLVELVQ
jgi:transcriptional regulator with XRE-family HTH domain